MKFNLNSKKRFLNSAWKEFNHFQVSRGRSRLKNESAYQQLFPWLQDAPLLPSTPVPRRTAAGIQEDHNTASVDQTQKQQLRLLASLTWPRMY